MRFIFTILFFNAIVTFAQSSNVKPCEAQIDSLTKLSVYRKADTMASFPGGMQALYSQIYKRTLFPKSHKFEDGIKVYVAFVVQQNGKVTGQRIIKNVSGTTLAEQFLDILDDFVWKPGICNDKVVSTLEILPIIIELK